MEYPFRPREAIEMHRSERARGRGTPLTHSRRAGARIAAPRRAAGGRYDRRADAHAAARACRRAGVPRWHPHQLRRNVATRLRMEFGLDVARISLGHSSPTVTEVYAEVDRARALAVIEQVG
jgi:integrase